MTSLKYMLLIFQAVLAFAAAPPSIAVSSEKQKPLSIIFLDIDGVLIHDRSIDPLRTWIQQKLVELFGKRDEMFREYTELEWRIAASHFLLSPALENLEKLIERMSKVAEVAIVLSSAWRLDGTVDEIKNQMFAIGSFSKRIIDKTPEDDWWRAKKRRRSSFSNRF